MGYRTVEEILHTLQLENGEVFIVSKGRRMMLAKCGLKIDIVQSSATFKARNSKGYDVKKRYVSVVFCLDMKTAKNITDEIFRSIEKYEIYGEFEKSIGVYEKIKFDNLLEECVDLYENEWRFRIEDSETVKKLINMCRSSE